MQRKIVVVAGRHHCCSGKAALVLVLFLIGSKIGYCAGRHHSGWGCHYVSCPMMGTQAPASK